METAGICEGRDNPSDVWGEQYPGRYRQDQPDRGVLAFRNQRIHGVRGRREIYPQPDGGRCILRCNRPYLLRKPCVRAVYVCGGGKPCMAYGREGRRGLWGICSKTQHNLYRTSVKEAGRDYREERRRIAACGGSCPWKDRADCMGGIQKDCAWRGRGCLLLWRSSAALYLCPGRGNRVCEPDKGCKSRA